MTGISATGASTSEWLRIVLLKHGVNPVLSNRALYTLTSVGMALTVVIMAALLGLRIEAPG